MSQSNSASNNLIIDRAGYMLQTIHLSTRQLTRFGNSLDEFWRLVQEQVPTLCTSWTKLSKDQQDQCSWRITEVNREFRTCMSNLIRRMQDSVSSLNYPQTKSEPQTEAVKARNAEQLNFLAECFEALDTLNKDWRFALISLNSVLGSEPISKSVQLIMWDVAEIVERNYNTRGWKDSSTDFDLALVGFSESTHTLRNSLKTCLFLTSKNDKPKVERKEEDVRLKSLNIDNYAFATWLAPVIPSARLEVFNLSRDPTLPPWILVLDYRLYDQTNLTYHQHFMQDVVSKALGDDFETLQVYVANVILLEDPSLLGIFTSNEKKQSVLQLEKLSESLSEFWVLVGLQIPELCKHWTQLTPEQRNEIQSHVEKVNSAFQACMQMNIENMIYVVESLVPITDDMQAQMGFNYDLIYQIQSINKPVLNELERFFVALNTLNKDWQYALFSLNCLIRFLDVGNPMGMAMSQFDEVQIIMYKAANTVQKNKYPKNEWKIPTSIFCRDLAVQTRKPVHSLRTTLKTCLFLTGDEDIASVEKRHDVLAQIAKSPPTGPSTDLQTMYDQARATWLGKKRNGKFEGPKIENYLALDQRQPTRGGRVPDDRIFLRDTVKTIPYTAFKNLRLVVQQTYNVPGTPLPPLPLPSSSQTSVPDEPLPGAASISENIPSRPPASLNLAPRPRPSTPPAEHVAPVSRAAKANDEGFSELKAVANGGLSSISLEANVPRGEWVYDTSREIIGIVGYVNGVRRPLQGTKVYTHDETGQHLVGMIGSGDSFIRATTQITLPQSSRGVLADLLRGVKNITGWRAPMPLHPVPVS